MTIIQLTWAIWARQTVRKWAWHCRSACISAQYAMRWGHWKYVGSFTWSVCGQYEYLMMKNVCTDKEPLIISCVHRCLITLTPSVLNRALSDWSVKRGKHWDSHTCDHRLIVETQRREISCMTEDDPQNGQHSQSVQILQLWLAALLDDCEHLFGIWGKREAEEDIFPSVPWSGHLWLIVILFFTAISAAKLFEVGPNHHCYPTQSYGRSEMTLLHILSLLPRLIIMSHSLCHWSSYVTLRIKFTSRWVAPNRVLSSYSTENNVLQSK